MPELLLSLNLLKSWTLHILYYNISYWQRISAPPLFDFSAPKKFSLWVRLPPATTPLLPPQLALKSSLVRLQSCQTSKEVYELRNFTNANRKNCAKCSFFKVAFFCRASSIKKSKYCCHPPFHSPIFRRYSWKLLSFTFPILMNWILLSPPPLSSDPDTPLKLGTCV